MSDEFREGKMINKVKILIESDAANSSDPSLSFFEMYPVLNSTYKATPWHKDNDLVIIEIDFAGSLLEDAQIMLKLIRELKSPSILRIPNEKEKDEGIEYCLHLDDLTER